MKSYSMGRRGVLLYLAFVLSLGGIVKDDFDYRSGAIGAVWVGELQGPRGLEGAVPHDHDSIRDNGPIQQALAEAHQRRVDGVDAHARVGVEDQRSFYLVVQAYLAMPSSSRANDRVGSYVEYEGEIYMIRIDEGIL